MSLELHDLRTKVSLVCVSLIEAKARCEGKDKSEVAREILHEWTRKQVDMYKVADKLMRVEGISGLFGEND